MGKFVDPHSGEQKFYKGRGRKQDKSLGRYDATIKKRQPIEGKMNAHLADYRPLHRLTEDGIAERNEKLDQARTTPKRQRVGPLLTNSTNPMPKIRLKIKKPKFGQNTPIYDKVNKKLGDVIRDHHITADGHKMFDKVTVRYEDGTTDVVDCSQLQKHRRRPHRRLPGENTPRPTYVWRAADDEKDKNDGTPA